MRSAILQCYSMHVIISILAHTLLVTAYSTWCGKHYELGAPDTPPDPESYFSYPPHSPHQLLDFRCMPASSLYLASDATHDPPAIILDAAFTHDVGEPVHGGLPGLPLNVEVKIDGRLTADASLSLGQLGYLLPIDLAGLTPRIEPYQVECSTTIQQRTYTSSAELLYLPEKVAGSVVKLDRRSCATWVKKGKGPWEAIIPFGWYDGFDAKDIPLNEILSTHDRQSMFTAARRWATWLAFTLAIRSDDTKSAAKPRRWNMDRLELAHSLGYNMIHPVPPAKTYEHDGNDSAIRSYFDRAEELGIWVMYDMRHTLLDLDAIEKQVRAFRDRSNLLTWYIADEPDGPPTPTDITTQIHDLIRRLDPYHPISLVLNCNDHYWTSYSAGTDILLVDVYSIAMNPVWSKKWSTPVTSTFGASGCDGCRGNFYDLVHRLDDWAERKRIVGRRRDLVTWVVPQAFDDHGEEFWWRVPTGDEGAVQTVLAWNHGVMGHCAWIASDATPDLLNNASFLASHLYAQRSFLIDNASTRRSLLTTLPHHGQNGVDVAAWTRSLHGGITETLIMAVQMNYIGHGDIVEFGVVGVRGKVVKVLFGDVKEENGARFKMDRTSVAAVILREQREAEAEPTSQLFPARPFTLQVGVS